MAFWDKVRPYLHGFASMFDFFGSTQLESEYIRQQRELLERINSRTPEEALARDWYVVWSDMRAAVAKDRKEYGPNPISNDMDARAFKEMQRLEHQFPSVKEGLLEELHTLRRRPR